MKKRPGGRGKVETLRNDAVRLLRKVEPDKFTTYSLAKLFEVSHVRIIQILRESEKELFTG